MRNCELGNQEEILIRDLLITNMQDSEIQRELLRETVEPAQALRLSINMELGQQKQLQITKSQPTVQGGTIIPERQFRNCQSTSKFSSTNSTGESTVSKLRSHLVSES